MSMPPTSPPRLNERETRINRLVGAIRSRCYNRLDTSTPAAGRSDLEFPETSRNPWIQSPFFIDGTGCRCLQRFRCSFNSNPGGDLCPPGHCCYYINASHVDSASTDTYNYSCNRYPAANSGDDE